MKFLAPLVCSGIVLTGWFLSIPEISVVGMIYLSAVIILIRLDLVAKDSPNAAQAPTNSRVSTERLTPSCPTGTAGLSHPGFTAPCSFSRTSIEK